MLRDRAFQTMQAAANDAVAFMQTLSDSYLFAETDEERAKLAKEFPTKLKAYAQEKGLEAKETPLWAQQQFFMSTDETIGSAVDPQSLGNFQSGQVVGQRLFESNLLYQPMRADSQLRNKSYAYWKTVDADPKVPELDEVRDEVVKAWKLDQARPLARKRAEELAKQARTNPKDLSAALSGQTVTGKPDGTAVAVRQSGKFSWLTTPRNVPQFDFNSAGRVQLSTIDAVPGANYEFMETVFEKLQPEEIGVAANQDRTAFYVVQPIDRDGSGTGPTAEIATQALQQQFLGEGRREPSGIFGTVFQIPGMQAFPMLTPYDTLASQPQQQFQRAWFTEFEKRYGIAWPTVDPNNPDAMDESL